MLGEVPHLNPTGHHSDSTMVNLELFAGSHVCPLIWVRARISGVLSTDTASARYRDVIAGQLLVMWWIL